MNRERIFTPLKMEEKVTEEMMIQMQAKTVVSVVKYYSVFTVITGLL